MKPASSAIVSARDMARELHYLPGSFWVFLFRFFAFSEKVTWKTLRHRDFIFTVVVTGKQ